MPNVLTRSPYFVDVKNVEQYDVFANIYYIAVAYAGKEMEDTVTRNLFGANNLKYVAPVYNDGPRIDYLNDVPELLLEPMSYNLLRSSNKPNLSPDSYNTSVAPDASMQAVVPIFDTSNNNRFKFSIPGGSYSSGQKITYSYYVRRLIPKSSQVDDVFGELDLVPNSNFNLVTPHTKIQSNIGEGFDRYSATYEIVNGSSLSELKMFYDDAMGGVQGSVAYWGHQAEPLEYATSLIEATSTSNVSTVVFSNLRTKDEVLSVQGDGSYNGTEGVLYFEGSALYNDGTARVINLYEDTSTYVRIMYNTTNNSIRVLHKVNNVTLADFSTTDYDVTRNNKIAYKWSPNTLSFNVNGNLIDASVPTTSPSGNLQALDFQSSALGGFFYGRIRKLKVITEELNQSDIEALTDNEDTSVCTTIVASPVQIENPQKVRFDLFVGDVETESYGKPVIVNNLINNSEFDDTSSWIMNRGTLTSNNGIGKFVVNSGTTAGQNPDMYQSITLQANTTYKFEFRLDSNGHEFYIQMYSNSHNSVQLLKYNPTNGFETFAKTIAMPTTQTFNVSVGPTFDVGNQVIGGFTIDVDYFRIGETEETTVDYITTEPTYSITKNFDASGNNTFQIGTLLNDYMQASMANGYNSGQPKAFAVPYLLNDELTVRLDTICLSCYEGYGYFDEGRNPEINSPVDNVLTSTDTMYRVPGENFNVGVVGTEEGTTFFIGTEGSNTLDSYYTESSNKIEYITRTDEVYMLGDIGATNLNVKELDCTGNTPHRVTFVNKYGALEDIWFVGRVKESIDTESNMFSGTVISGDYYNKYKHSTRVIDKGGNASLLINSGFYPEDYNEAFKQLLLSESVWINYNGSIRPVNITSNNISFKTSLNDKLINYEIGLDLSYNLTNNLK